MNYTDQCLDPLSTPEICKMILSESDILYPSQPIREPGQYMEGLMTEFEEIASATMVSPTDVFGYGLENSVDAHPARPQSQNMAQTQHFQPQFQPYDNGYSSSSPNCSFPASPADSMGVNYDNGNMTLTNFNSFSAASPAESHFSSDSAVSFYNMDQPIKQEINDFPAVIEEINQSNSCQTTMVSQQQPMQYQQQYNIVPQQQQQPQQYQMVEPTYSYQQPEFLSQVPTTVTSMQQVSNVIYQQPIQHPNMTLLAQVPQVPQVISQQTPQQQHQQPAQVPQTVAGRKRSPAGTFASTSESSAPAMSQGPSGSKKTRLTKRQKQQLMDKQVDEYTQKNKDLRNQIELLERKVQFCTQFLQKYVSPIVQGRSNTWTPDIVNAVSVEAM